MPLYLPRNGPRIFFAHVPKTAGSSVRSYLAERYGSPSLADRTLYRDDMPLRHRGFTVPPAHFSAQDLGEFIPDEIDLLFAFVRDPLQRIVSEYKFQQSASASSRLSFSTWLRVALNAVKLDRRAYDNHLRPQCEMVPEAAEVFRLEDGFEAFVARLDEVSDGPSDLAITHTNRSKRPSASVKIHREDARLVGDFFACDYERFGYAKPQLTDYPSDAQARWRGVPAAVFSAALIAKQRRKWLG